MIAPDEFQPTPLPMPRKPRARPPVATTQELKLRESRLKEKELQKITRKILVTTEAARGSISLHLHDEIAQTLLGIHVRLLSLKQEARANNEGFAQELITTQRLVKESVETINRFASKLAIPDENQGT